MKVITTLDQPEAITATELKTKLFHMREVLDKWGCSGILLNSEGAMRWLTGIKHQLGDIAPAAVSPVNALVRFENGGSPAITIVTKQFEMPRLKMELPPVFDPVPGLIYNFRGTMPELYNGILSPDGPDYQAVTDDIIRPLIGGFNGNQYAKLSWLAKATMQVLGETAYQLTPGMKGLEVRGLMLKNLGAHDIDANLVLIALAGQHDFLHPVASANYTVTKNSWMKLVVGTRYAEHIMSQSLLVKLGGNISEREKRVYHALQDASMEYADCYRTGYTEQDIYTSMLHRFNKIEDIYELPGFGDSATLHHPGGGTSPTGNRDRMLDPQGMRLLSPWTQFAINPVDRLCGFKVELQGMVMPDGAEPHILDMSETARETVTFRKSTSSGGTSAMLPELLII